MKIYRIKAVAITFFVATVLSGCASDLAEMFPGNQPVPSETVSELMLRGASLGSISPSDNPLPDDIGATIFDGNQDMIEPGTLGITILPNDFINDNLNAGSFLYAFSKHLGDEVYELLLTQRFAVDGVPVKTFVELYQNELSPGMESLSSIASYILYEPNFFLPLTASHLELHFVSNNDPDADPAFVERWELQGFYGYDRYLAPLIP